MVFRGNLNLEGESNSVSKNQMPKEAKPFLALWLGGLLITDALIAAAFAAYFLLAHGEMVCQMEQVSSDSDAGKPCTNGAVAESADCGIAIVPIVECGVADNRSTRLIPVWRKPYRTSTVCFGRTRLASQFVPSLSAANLFQPILVWCRGQ